MSHIAAMQSNLIVLANWILDYKTEQYKKK